VEGTGRLVVGAELEEEAVSRDCTVEGAVAVAEGVAVGQDKEAGSQNVVEEAEDNQQDLVEDNHRVRAEVGNHQDQVEVGNHQDQDKKKWDGAAELQKSKEEFSG